MPLSTLSWVAGGTPASNSAWPTRILRSVSALRTVSEHAVSASRLSSFCGDQPSWRAVSSRAFLLRYTSRFGIVITEVLDDDGYLVVITEHRPGCPVAALARDDHVRACFARRPYQYR